MPVSALPEVVLASVPQPGEDDCSNIYITRGVVTRMSAADQRAGQFPHR